MNTNMTTMEQVPNSTTAKTTGNLDKSLLPVGAFVIISFLLIGLIVMGCMLYWNWSHRKQRTNSSDPFNNGSACIYEKSNPRTYNRSTSLIITATTHPYTGSDAENGSIVQKQ